MLACLVPGAPRRGGQGQVDSVWDSLACHLPHVQGSAQARVLGSVQSRRSGHVWLGMVTGKAHRVPWETRSLGLLPESESAL